MNPQQRGRGRTTVPGKEGKENLNDAQQVFLAAYGKMGVIRRACKVAGVGRQTHYDWMNASLEYQRAVWPEWAKYVAERYDLLEAIHDAD